MYYYSLLLPLLSIILQINGQDYSPVVTLPDGQIIGIKNETVGEKKTYYAYLGIPYAQKPVGPLRFSAPIKNDKWSNILYATSDDKICIQMSRSINEPIVIGSEDCLYINVYTRSLNSSLPVMVWIYGGGFISGSSIYNIYGPDYLIEKDIVFVSFNFRLGVFGYLSTEDLTLPGNMGMKDQILALKWVKNNIKYFGGDPNKITIAGESTGAASVGYLLQSPLTKGLYRAAIMQSGSALSRLTLTSNARRRAFDIGKYLGIKNVSSETLVEELQQVDAEKLQMAQNNVINMNNDKNFGGLPIGVVKEPNHSGSFFSSKSYELLASGEFNHVPIIIGHNSLEAAQLSDVEEFIKSLLNSTDGSIIKLLPRGLTDNPNSQMAAIQDIRSFYFGPNGTGTHDEIARFLSNEFTVRPTRKTVEFMSKYNKVYFYQFSYMGDLGYANRTFQGVSHAEDLRYLFNMNSGPNNKIPSPADALTRQRLIILWTNFIKTLNPTPSDYPSILKIFKWIPNDCSTPAWISTKYLNINESLEMKENPWEKSWNFFKKIYNDYGDSDYSTY